MPFQKFGTGDGRVLKPEPEEREQMQRTASKIEAKDADTREGHYEEEDVD